MGFLIGKKILIVGISNKFSLSWGIAKQMHKYGAELAFTYSKKKKKTKIKNLVKEVNSNKIFFCDIRIKNSIKNLFKNLYFFWKKFDGIVHSIAFSPLISNIQKKNIENITCNDFLSTHEICSFSLLALIKESKNFLNFNSSILTLSYIGSSRYISGYMLLNSAKASLESNIKYLAYSLGKNNIRVNVISSGPIMTVSSRKIYNFSKILKISKKFSPLKRNVTLKEIGNTASFLCSNLSSGITGQIIYVDAGFNISGII
ncbi:enoyl-ACP reductase FabI [Buchnera aphidicola]|uniref:enoyl-ACP reductase FabI n=1 Tax=Buchnera aphidicola TaxID=9 RepID=UPI0031B6BF19